MPGDESYYRLFHVRLYEFSRSFFRIAANFADHDDSFGLRVAVEKVEGIHEIRADDGIAANANRRGLPNATSGELMHGFVGQSAGAGNNPD